MRLCLFILLLLLTAAVTGDDEQAVRVREAVEEVLAERFPDLAQRLEVRVKRVEGDVKPNDVLRVSFTGTDVLPRGTAQVKLLTGDDTVGWTRAGWALIEVAHFDSVLVTTTRLSSGDPVQAEALTAAWMEITMLPGEPLTPATYHQLLSDGEVLAGRALGEGRALRRSDVRTPYAADVGDQVMMRYRRGTLVFDLPCKAREAGQRGDEIRVYSPETSRIYRARLTGPGTAQWTETL